MLYLNDLNLQMEVELKLDKAKRLICQSKAVKEQQKVLKQPVKDKTSLLQYLQWSHPEGSCQQYLQHTRIVGGLHTSQKKQKKT